VTKWKCRCRQSITLRKAGNFWEIRCTCHKENGVFLCVFYLIQVWCWSC